MSGPGDLAIDAGIEMYELDGELNRAFLVTKVLTVLTGLHTDSPSLISPSARTFATFEDVRRRDGVRRLGFTAMSTFYPPHVDVINQVFAPSAEERESAAAVVQRYEQALSDGDPAVLGEATARCFLCTTITRLSTSCRIPPMDSRPDSVGSVVRPRLSSPHRRRHRAAHTIARPNMARLWLSPVSDMPARITPWLQPVDATPFVIEVSDGCCAASLWRVGSGGAGVVSAEIARRLARGEGQKVVAAAVGVSTKTIRRFVHAEGMPGPRRKDRSPRQLSTAEREEISRGLVRVTRSVRSRRCWTAIRARPPGR